MADLFDVVVARKLSGGSGGEPVIEALSVTENDTYTAPSGVDGYSPVTVNVSGGSSDFSTAQVTIINNHSSGIVFCIPTYYEADLYPAEAFFETRIEQSQTKNVPTILYKNRATGLLRNIEDATYACTGGVTNDGDGYVVVSGDGTITIS